MVLGLAACSAREAKPDKRPPTPDTRFLSPGLADDAVGRTYPWRALQARDGELFLSPDGQAANKPAGASLSQPVVLVDDGTYGARSRLHVLCAQPDVRVAVYVDQLDVAPVASNGTFMSATPSIPRDVTPLTPGIRVLPGTRVDPREPGPRGTRVIALKGFLLDAQGYVRASKVGFAWQQEPEPEFAESPNLELPRGAPILDGPRGHVLATLRPYSNAEQTHLVTALAPPAHGHVLVRYQDSRAVVVGFVDETLTQKIPQPAETGEAYGEGGLGIRGAGLDTVAVAACGTTLAGDDGAPVGVVLQERAFLCESDCATRTPRVWVPACASRVLVRAYLDAVKPCPAVKQPG